MTADAPHLSTIAQVLGVPTGFDCRAEVLTEGPDQTADLARRVAPLLAPGDTILLQGDLGSGKTHFARALIRAALGDDGADVPSPSFTLVQSYDTPLAEIWHADLYRLSDVSELLELGLQDAAETAICVIEWPDRFEDAWPAGSVCLTFGTDADAPDQRAIGLWAPGASPLAARVALAFAE